MGFPADQTPATVASSVSEVRAATQGVQYPPGKEAIYADRRGPTDPVSTLSMQQPFMAPQHLSVTILVAMLPEQAGFSASMH